MQACSLQPQAQRPKAYSLQPQAAGYRPKALKAYNIYIRYDKVGLYKI